MMFSPQALPFIMCEYYSIFSKIILSNASELLDIIITWIAGSNNTVVRSELPYTLGQADPRMLCLPIKA
jgi:hypothetical protein